MTLEQMATDIRRMTAETEANRARAAEVRETIAKQETHIAEQRRAMESARAEAATLKARAAELESHVAWLESGIEPVQCSMGRPARPNGVTDKLARRRPLFAATLARRDELVASEGLSRAEAWARLMEQEPGLREALIDEAARNNGGCER